MMMRLKTEEGEATRNEERQEFEDILTNDAYGDSTIKTRLNSLKNNLDYQ
jgi:hypothetical protein